MVLVRRISKKEKEKAKKVKHLTHINLKGITKGTPESDIHTYISNNVWTNWLVLINFKHFYNNYVNICLIVHIINELNIRYILLL